MFICLEGSRRVFTAAKAGLQAVNYWKLIGGKTGPLPRNRVLHRCLCPRKSQPASRLHFSLSQLQFHGNTTQLQTHTLLPFLPNSPLVPR